MVKHVLVAVASAAALLSGGTAEAARQQCPAVCNIATDVCDDTSSVNCHFCILPEHSPVAPCFFGP